LTDSSNWGEWVLNETGAYGFRFDAIKHISVGHRETQTFF
jgi:hypothetical protein